MANTKYSIFVGSTYEDLKEERWEVMKAILKMKHIPLGMEFFPGTGEDQFEYIKRVIDDCDYYLILLGGKYGTIRPGGSLSYTEMEYDYAKSTGKDIIGVVYRSPETISDPSKKETDPEKYQKFCNFREKIRKGLVEHWNNISDIRLVVTASLADIIINKPAIGWTRGDEHLSSKYSDLLAKYGATLEENKALNVALASNISLFDGSKFASINDNHTITISYLVNPDYDTAPNRQGQFTRTLSEFFVFMGQLPFRDSPQISEIKKHFEWQIQNALNVQWANPDAADVEMIGSLTVTTEDFEKILNHFELLGLVDSYAGSGTAYLTEQGKQYYLSCSAIKKE